MFKEDYEEEVIDLAPIVVPVPPLINMANAPTAAQIATIPEFKGLPSRAQEVDDWFFAVETIKTQYGWTDPHTGAAAKNRMKGTAAQWIQCCTYEGKDIADWPHLKAAMILDFRSPITATQAAQAMNNLKQGPNESGVKFKTRITLALITKDSQLTAAHRATPQYMTQFNQDQYNFVLAGLRDEFKVPITSNTINPPANITQLLAAVVALESVTLENGQANGQGGAVAAVTDEDEMADLVKSLTAHEINAIRAMVRGQGQRYDNRNNGSNAQGSATNRFADKECYGCHKMGHIKPHCPNASRGAQGSQSNRGSGGGRGGGRGGYKKNGGGSKGRSFDVNEPNTNEQAFGFNSHGSLNYTGE